MDSSEGIEAYPSVISGGTSQLLVFLRNPENRHTSQVTPVFVLLSISRLLGGSRDLINYKLTDGYILEPTRGGLCPRPNAAGVDSQ
jgi:hypothetical protein